MVIEIIKMSKMLNEFNKKYKKKWEKLEYNGLINWIK